MVRKEIKMEAVNLTKYCDEKNKRWGVYAWTRYEDGSVEARINNTYASEAEAKAAAENTEFRYGYTSRVIVPEELFDHAWAMIGATVEASR